VLGVDGRDVHARRGQQALDVAHGGDEPLLLARAERREQRAREVVGALVERATLGPAGRGEPRDADPPVALAGRHRHEPVGFERAEQPAQIAGVEPQTRPQQPHFAPVAPDLPQQPRLAQRPLEAQETVVERPHPLRDRAVEPADLLDHRLGHSLTIVSESCGRNRTAVSATAEASRACA
jgi:hypothetical protein